MKTVLVYNTSTCEQHSSKTLIKIGSIFGFRIFSSDATQANLQSAEKLMRDVHIKPLPQICSGQNQVLQLIKPLHELAKRGNYQGRIRKYRIVENPGMKSKRSDAVLFCKRVGSEIFGMCALYNDDTLHAGANSYSEQTQGTERKFHRKEID